MHYSLFILRIIFSFSGFWVHGNVCNNDVFDLDCTNDDYYCHLLDSNASSCACLGKGCKQTCKSLVQDCEMVLNCSGGDCEQTCNAKTCKLNCSRGQCKKQECYDKRDFCEMYLECSEGDCEQTCNAKTCKLNCRGEQCRKQQCKNEVEMCNMHCNAIDCTQTCDAVTCHITRTWLTSPQGRVTCSGNGKYCGSLMSSLDSYPLTQGIFFTDDGGDKRCTCSKCLRGFCSSSDSYRSNFISSAPSMASQGFSTQISTVQQKDKSHTWGE